MRSRHSGLLGQRDKHGLAQRLQRRREAADERRDGIDRRVYLRFERRDACARDGEVHLRLAQVEVAAQARLAAGADEFKRVGLELGVPAGVVQAGLKGAQGDVGRGEIRGEKAAGVADILLGGGEVGGGRLDVAADAAPEVELPRQEGAGLEEPGRIVGNLGPGAVGLAGLPVVYCGAGKADGRRVAGAGDAELRGVGVEARDGGRERGVLLEEQGLEGVEDGVVEDGPPRSAVGKRRGDGGIGSGPRLGAVPFGGLEIGAK